MGPNYREMSDEQLHELFVEKDDKDAENELSERGYWNGRDPDWDDADDDVREE